jgi:hypothetical protein
MKKHQQDYVNWKSLLRLCFAQDTTVFTTEKVKILHTVRLLTSDAYNNNHTAFEFMTINPDDVQCWACSTVKALFSILNVQYKTMDLKLNTGISFDQLFQQKTPFSNFIAKFNTLAFQCKKTNKQKVNILKKKVSQELAEKLATLENPPDDNNYANWVKKC